MRIAMLGTRGVPASYSGFETCVEQLGSRLAARGHEVTVYCRSPHIRYDQPFYKGMRLVKLPTIANKYLDTIVHSFISSLHALGQQYDVCLYFIAGNSLVTWIPRLAGQKTAINVDGLDWKRDKWPQAAKHFIQFSERMADKLANRVITDSRIVQAYYRDVYRVDTTYIAYGSEVTCRPPGETLAQWGLTPRRYLLFVGRLVPENCAHHLVQAFGKVNLPPDMKCVIVGDAPYAEAYIHELKGQAGANVIFTGYCFGQGYQELSSNAYAFLETSSVGGTHPALLEAMAFGNCVVVNDTPENLETVGDAGFSYGGAQGAEGLVPVLQHLLDQPQEVAEYRQRALGRVQACYTWENVTDAYEGLCQRLTGRSEKKG